LGSSNGKYYGYISLNEPAPSNQNIFVKLWIGSNRLDRSFTIRNDEFVSTTVQFGEIPIGSIEISEVQDQSYTKFIDKFEYDI